MTDAAYPLFSIFAFIGFIISLVPLPWHLQAWNSGTCYYMMWASLACLNQFINSVVWAGNSINHSPAWCEISIRILMASSVGLPAASLCINRRLYHIATVQAVSIGPAEKTRAIIVDTLICVVFPLLFVAWQYIVQGHRFNIFEDIGCYPALYNTVVTYFTTGMWPILVGLISATYCTLSLRAFTRRRLEFSRFMHSNKSSLTMGRYFRLMALAMTEILFTLPLAIFNMYLNTSIAGVGRWVSWADTHFAYYRMEQIPALIWKQNHMLVVAMELTRWVAPLCAFVFFGFFGFADEAKRNYRKAFSSIITCLHLKRDVEKKPDLFASDKASIGKFKPLDSSASCYPQSPYPLSATLPAYSPPPSAFSPVYDIKRIEPPSPSLQPEPRESTYDLEMSSVDSHASTHHDDSTPSPQTRYSFGLPSLPFSSRRNTSYF